SLILRLAEPTLFPYTTLFRSICPFHDETDASFSVSPEKNIWYCFGCGKGTTIIDFVKEYHKVKFPKAVEMLLDYSKLDISNLKEDRKSTRLNSSHVKISYAVF